MMWTVAVGTVLVVASSASQLFEDLPTQSLGEARLYQEGNDFDSGHADTALVDDKNVLGQTEEERALFLIKIMQALRMRNEDSGHYRRTIPESVDFLDIQNVPEGFGHEEGKPLMWKRLSADPNPALKTIINPKSSYEAQRRWKAKKGNVVDFYRSHWQSSQMLCYFKLCAFRPPS